MIEAAPVAETFDIAPVAAEVAIEPVSNVNATITMLGRIQLAISPVPDFDRLLHLDSSLGKMGGVHGVTLADYAHEEVTFRVDLNGPISARDFAGELSDKAGVNAEVTAASESSLTLRLG